MCFLLSSIAVRQVHTPKSEPTESLNGCNDKQLKLGMSKFSQQLSMDICPRAACGPSFLCRFQYPMFPDRVLGILPGNGGLRVLVGADQAIVSFTCLRFLCGSGLAIFCFRLGGIGNYGFWELHEGGPRFLGAPLQFWRQYFS